jgi:hypothetical protein
VPESPADHALAIVNEAAFQERREARVRAGLARPDFGHRAIFVSASGPAN